jgi:hypothetical protein
VIAILALPGAASFASIVNPVICTVPPFALIANTGMPRTIVR